MQVTLKSLHERTTGHKAEIEDLWRSVRYMQQSLERIFSTIHDQQRLQQKTRDRVDILESRIADCERLLGDLGASE